jgi:hypothetical protein
MGAAFSNALYYPHIDISNLEWLKTAVLFWDSISTIVPLGMNVPYKQSDTQYLESEEFLKPINVNSNDEAVIEIENEFIEYVNSPAFYETLMNKEIQQNSCIYRHKLPPMLISTLMEIANKFRFREATLYGEKMGYKLIRELRYFKNENGEFYDLPVSFVYSYMTELSNKICEKKSLAPITDDLSSFKISDQMRFNSPNSFYTLHQNRSVEQRFDQGILLDLIVKGFNISPDTSLADVITFKKHNSDELGNFRTQLAKLTQGISSCQSMKQAQEEINNIYCNEFKPAYNNFKKAINGAGIKCFFDNFVKMSLFSVPSSSLLSQYASLDVPQALLAGVGVSLIASTVNYRLDKAKTLRENPYSYLLLTEKEYSR